MELILSQHKSYLACIVLGGFIFTLIKLRENNKCDDLEEIYDEMNKNLVY